jgi:hypothetical protein
MNNNNGKPATCDTFAEITNYIDVADNQQLTTSTAGVDGMTVAFSTKCNTTGTGTQTAGARSFTLMYAVETRTGTAPRCLGS